MSQPIKLLPIVIILASLAAGCAQPARKTAMVAPVSSETILPEASPLRNSVAIGRVSGGQETDPLWTSEVSSADFQEALKLSLKQHTILGSAGAPLNLEAELIELDQPIIGFDMKVTSTVRYIVKSEAGETAFDETIVSPYTANFSSSVLGVERLRLANEGAIRKSISDFISALVKDAAAEPDKYRTPPIPAPAPGSPGSTGAKTS